MKIEEMKVSEFTDALASGAPVPGGGGASALAGSLAAALGGMVAELTIGKKKYADVEEEVRQQRDKAAQLRQRLLALADADAEVFLPLSKAYGLPKETEEQKRHKAEVMEQALRSACEVPLDIMACCTQAIDIADFMAQKGSVMAVSDAAAAAALAEGALKAASLNVYINTKSMTDRTKAAAYNKQADSMLAEYVPYARRIFDVVMEKLYPNTEV